MSEDPPPFIPTKCSKLYKTSQDDFTIITHQSQKKKNHSADSTSLPVIQKPDIKGVKAFNIKQAKQEVIKYGMSGFDSQKQGEVKAQLACKLGAKPPKKKCINYKKLLEDKKEMKEKLHLEFQQSGKNRIGKSLTTGKEFYKKKRKLANKKDKNSK